MGSSEKECCDSSCCQWITYFFCRSPKCETKQYVQVCSKAEHHDHQSDEVIVMDVIRSNFSSRENSFSYTDLIEQETQFMNVVRSRARSLSSGSPA